MSVWAAGTWTASAHRILFGPAHGPSSLLCINPNVSYLEIFASDQLNKLNFNWAKPKHRQRQHLCLRKQPSMSLSSAIASWSYITQEEEEGEAEGGEGEMRTSNLLFKALTPFCLQKTLLVLSLLFIAYLLLSSNPQPPSFNAQLPFGQRAFPISRRHIVFAIGSSSGSFTARRPYLRLWYSPNTTRAFAFLDGPPSSPDGLLPPTIISQETSAFPYSFKGGFRSAIRLARIAKEIVELAESDVRWFVFGDDDTIFFVDNLVKVLSKYDYTRWYYIGTNSESYFQNAKNSFDMAFGGGGFAISRSLADVLAKVLDSCLFRYAHLYGSDSRIFSCVAELGVGLTHEPGFHQVLQRTEISLFELYFDRDILIWLIVNCYS